MKKLILVVLVAMSLVSINTNANLEFSGDHDIPRPLSIITEQQSA